MIESPMGQGKMEIESTICQTETDDVISRQAALKAVSWDSEAYYAVNNLPPIDPVKHGMWIVVKRHEHYPSGKPYEQVQCPFCKRFDNNGDGSFCGYCGAMMERNEE